MYSYNHLDVISTCNNYRIHYIHVSLLRSRIYSQHEVDLTYLLLMSLYSESFVCLSIPWYSYMIDSLSDSSLIMLSRRVEDDLIIKMLSYHYNCKLIAQSLKICCFRYLEDIRYSSLHHRDSTTHTLRKQQSILRTCIISRIIRNNEHLHSFVLVNIPFVIHSYPSQHPSHPLCIPYQSNS